MKKSALKDPGAILGSEHQHPHRYSKQFKQENMKAPFKMKGMNFGNECSACGNSSCACPDSPVKNCGNTHSNRVFSARGGRIGPSASKIAIKNIGRFLRNIVKDVSQGISNIKEKRRIKKSTKKRKKLITSSKTSHTSPRTLKSSTSGTYDSFGDD